ncbi:hypothetical protein C1645_750500 [Glomus cerebriforme]|uniref:Uncharacterized protein n=1 Tax=Glomus cerebriforme TaxID=658196 RepID=A0A397TMP5_9GLOM|nr:hypothetical protein C1645_750500 [Glomus cerebriforme]
MAASDDVSTLKKLFWVIMFLANACAFASSLYFVIVLIYEFAIYRSIIITFTIAELLPRLAIIVKIFEYSKSDLVKPKFTTLILTLIGKLHF